MAKSKTKKHELSLSLKGLINNIINCIKWLLSGAAEILILASNLAQWAISTFGKAIAWLWAFVLMSILIIAIALYLTSVVIKNIDDTSWNEMIKEKSTPLIEKLIEQKIEEIEAENR